MDLIDRQAAVDVVHKIIYGFFDLVNDDSEEPISDKDELLLEVNKAICNGIKDLPPAPPEQRWTPCSEGLPEEGHDVLITKEPFKIKGYEQEVIKAKRSVDPRSGKIEWRSPEFGTLTNKAVLAWMSLPEGYRGEQE